MKTMGYLLFAGLYYLYAAFRRPDKKKVFCIMTHDDSADSSVGCVVQAIKKYAPEYRFFYVRKGDRKGSRKERLAALFSFFFVKPFQMAGAGYVLQDNIFLPMAYIRFRKTVRVIQLWHGTGTIKRFGQSVNTGRLGNLEKKADRTITDLIVNSEYTKRLYQEAFGTREEQMRLYGLPRTDALFQEEKRREALGLFYKEYPELREKKLILYAPTFRDGETQHPDIALDIKEFLKQIPEEYVLGIRLHPFVAEAFNRNYREMEKEKERVYQFSDYRNLNALLFASHMLITDYSSIIFEYCVLKKPMLFFAYDLEEFSCHGRGFYENYEVYVPGPIAKDTAELARLILKGEFDKKRIEEFCRLHYAYQDGRSAKRLLEKVFHISC